jgi:hypothetical protein
MLPAEVSSSQQFNYGQGESALVDRIFEMSPE